MTSRKQMDKLNSLFNDYLEKERFDKQTIEHFKSIQTCYIGNYKTDQGALIFKIDLKLKK
jgi:hypothetical protein